MSTGHGYQHRSNIRRTELLHERCAELLTFIVCTFTVLVVVSSPHQQRFTATRPTATSSVSTLQESARGGLNSVLLVEGRNTLAFSTGSTIHKCVEIRSSWSTPTSGTVDSIFNNLEFRSLRVTSVGVSFTMVMPIAINANSQSLTNVFWRLRYRDSSNVPKGLVQYSDASPTLTTSTTTTRTYSLTFTLVFGITHLYRLLESLQGDVCFDITNTLIPATTLSIAGTVSTSGYIYLNSMMIFNGSSFSNYASCNTACASTGYGGYAFASISSDANSIAQALMTKYPSTTAWIGLTSTSSTFSASACCYTQWTTVGTTVYNTCVAGLSNTPSSTYTSPLVGSCANGNTYKLTASTGQWTTQTAALTACLCSGTTTDIQWSSGRAYSVLTGRWDTSSHTISPTQTRGSFSWQASTSTSNSRSNEASLSKTI
ncbi:Hypothetical protein, putative [Bodo saltans]|uniref:Uncharacterized protein n=1 Tax=Bodo saltans TaxID=75058 RepID=A0A0S4IRI6_BODSA|nr:Hypothetical protein, putative [Bodo saltans]|eukprot:CUF43482.1 Hypothetical protein, putative [Bodo saltans]